MTSSLTEVLYARGHAVYSELGVEMGAFAPFAARALAAAGPRDPSTIHAEDLYLACACSMGNSKAIEVFEARNSEMLRRMAHRAEAAGVNPSDLMQHLRVRLFVKASENGAMAIKSYVGTGPLGGWLRVVLARLATELIERNAAERRAVSVDDETWAGIAVAGDDLELGAMRSDMRASFQRALNQAAEAMRAEERALLRQYYVHKVGVDGIAKLLGIHRSNASRAVARARGNLMREARRLLGEHLRLSDGSLNSAFGLMRSDVALNLDAVLQSTGK